MSILSSRVGVVLVVVIASLLGTASLNAAPTSFSYQGRIVGADGTPLEYGSVAFEFTVTSPDGTCVLFKESVAGVDMRNSGGLFDTPIGRGTQTYPTDPTKNILSAFDNSATLTCSGGLTYTPAADDSRRLRVQFWDGAGWKLIAPDSVIRSVPFAGHAMRAAKADTALKLGANVAADFVLKSSLPTSGCPSGEALTWTVTGFACVTASGGGGGGGGSGLPTTASNGDVLKYASSSWVAGKLNYRDLVNSNSLSPWPSACGSGEFVTWLSASDSFACSAVSSSAVTTALGFTPANSGASISAGTGLSGGGTLAANRTLSVDVGTTAGKIPQLDSSGKLVASVLPSIGIADLKTAGGAAQFAASTCANGQVFKYDTSTSQWICGNDNNSGGSIASVTGTSPISVTTGANPVVSLATSGVSANTYRSVTVDTYGRVTAGTNPSTLADYGVTLTSGQIIVGNASNVPTPVAMSGDATIANTGALTVTKIQGRSVVTTAPTTDQVLKFNGTSWAPAADAGIDTVTGSTSVTVTNGSTSPVISLPTTGVSAGSYHSVTVDTTGRVTAGSNTLNSAQMWIGNASNVATAVSLSGDVSVTNAGVVTVDSLQSRAVASTAPGSNQILKWNGTAWAPAADAGITSVTGTAPIVVATGTTAPEISLQAGGVSASHLDTALQNGLWTVSGSNVYRPANSSVGIGVSSPRATLDVDGAIVSNATTDNAAATTINFATGNIQWASTNCKAFALHNLKDGGAYTFVVKGATSATCSFTAFSGAGTTALTVHMPTDHAATFANKHTMYNLIVAGTDVYISWTPGY